MIQVELKPLFARLNTFSTRALENAAGLTLSRTHYEITVEHLLRQLLEDPQGDFALILTHFDLDPLRLTAQLDESLALLKNGNPGRPVFSSLLTEWVQDAWITASLVIGSGRIRGGTLVLALLSRLSYYTAGTRYGDLMKMISREQLTQNFTSIVAYSSEGPLENLQATVAAPSSAGTANINGEENIRRFCEDLTAKASAGRIDPVFGRDNEIRQMIDILARRRKNNPIAVGEPGVGKSAVVEGMALAIVRNEVPEFLRNTRLLSLDLGLLEAGASVKGEFENRLRGVIDEIKASTTPIILFIDEAHMLIGAGGSAGGTDAANLLKPALARGELRTIAATTWSEYKKYFEKDPALARRFQLVKLDEPDVKTTALILRGLKGHYEKVHGVSVRDDAIVAAAELSNRYITSRLLPDKAVDLIDTACARVRIGLDTRPASLENLERRQAALLREQEALQRDLNDGFPVDGERLESIEKEMKALEGEYDTLASRWNTEREVAQRVLEARRKIALTAEREKTDINTKDKEEEENSTIVDWHAELIDARNTLAALQSDNPLIFTEVNPDTIARVVSDWTGVPLGKVLRDSAGIALALADNLKSRIHGQDQAVETIAEILKAAQSGLRDPQQPLGVFLLVGPSGVGKTESALAVADNLFGGEQALTSIAMSEFQEKHTVSRLVGSPPGYVGYGEGGILTEAVRKRPWSAVLLDEVEKAHLDVVNLFYQVFDKGTLSDGEGRQIDFSNTVVFLTSNLATEEITAMCASGRPDPDTLIEKIRPVLSKHFKPALLARMTIVPYFTLPAEYLTGIVRLKLERLASRLLSSSKVRLTFNETVIKSIAERCTEVESGARNIDFILRKSLTPHLSDVLLSALAEQKVLSEISVNLDTDGSWLIETQAAN